MSTVTLGTTGHTSLTAIKYLPGYGSGMAAADIATIALAIKNDQVNGRPIFPGALEEGRLFIPNRGVLNILPGDFIAYDPTTGWPILISAASIASGPWTHT